MPCETFKEDLQAYLDGELAPPRRGALEVHLAECAECARVIEELQTVSAAMSRWTDGEPSDRFQFMMQFRPSTENLPSEETAAPERASEKPPATRPAAARRRSPLLLWFTTGWRPVGAVVSTLLLLVAIVALRGRSGSPTPLRPRVSTDMVRAFIEAGPSGDLSEAYIYAANAGKRAIEADKLDAARVASSEVVYNFLASMDSAGEKRAGWRLINLLSHMRPNNQVAHNVHVGMLAGWTSLLWVDMYAATSPAPALALGRSCELQGRLREALTRYESISEGEDALAARLAEGALRLRMGDLDGAERALLAATEAPDSVVRNSGLALLDDLAKARKARKVLPFQRETAKTAEDWYLLGVMEIRAYDFRNAANSFMKASNTAQDDADLGARARFRSAWCQKEIGQISTAIYGFRTIAAEGDGRDGTLQYSAGIMEAVALTRIGRWAESVEACRSLLKKAPPDDVRHLESLAYFHKGCVELHHLSDINAASESLGRVASGGQGNLSFAAQYLLQSSGR